MIVVNQHESALECTLCGELEGMSQKALGNPETIARLQARVEAEHRDCLDWADDPSRARSERRFKLRMRAEMRNAQLA